MSRIICIPSRRVKPTRHIARPAMPFGDGIFAKPIRFEPTDEDKAAAAMFGDDADWDVRMAEADQPEPDSDMLAGEAASLDAMCALTPPPAGICKTCGQPSEALSWGMCPGCYDDDATDAAIACVNSLYGLVRRVF
jgi:hypothetical protein